MKFLIITAFLFITIFSTILTNELDPPKILHQWKLLQEKFGQIDPNDYENLKFMNHLIQYNENYENVTKTHLKVGKPRYLGCYRDHVLQRMFRGYADREDKSTYIEGCIEKCRLYKFVYAGLQYGAWCHCGNSAPQSSLNERLDESFCDKKCSSEAHKHEMCGGYSAMSVYTTGYTVTRQDENGYIVGESSMYSKREWSLIINCKTAPQVGDSGK